jgi:hypothetical protein
MSAAVHDTNGTLGADIGVGAEVQWSDVETA